MPPRFAAWGPGPCSSISPISLRGHDASGCARQVLGYCGCWANCWLEGRTSGQVLVVDATRLRQLGGARDDWRLHTAYNLRATRLCQVTVTDRHGGESLLHYRLRPGDIVLNP